jgi:hypothetical protein
MSAYRPMAGHATENAAMSERDSLYFRQRREAAAI